MVAQEPGMLALSQLHQETQPSFVFEVHLELMFVRKAATISTP